MQHPPVNDLNRCTAILMLRTAKCKQDEVAEYLGTAKTNVVAVEKWFRELHYEEAKAVCFDHAIDCTRVLELDDLKDWLQKQTQDKVDKMDAISILGHYCHVKIKETKLSVRRPRPSEHHARLAITAEKLRLNIKDLKQTRRAVMVGNILSGRIKTSTTEQELQSVDRLDAERLLSHLKAMYPDFKGIDNWHGFDGRESVTNFSIMMLDELKEVSHGRAIRGTCEICKSSFPKV